MAALGGNRSLETYVDLDVGIQGLQLINYFQDLFHFAVRFSTNVFHK